MNKIKFTAILFIFPNGNDIIRCVHWHLHHADGPHHIP